MLSNLFKNNSYKDSDLISALRLIRTESIGVRTFYSLMKYFGSSISAVDNINEFMNRAGKKNFKLISQDEVFDEISKMDKFGAKYLLFTDPKYPKLLKQTSSAPPVLTYKGNLDLLHNKIVAIVGSRNASLAGIKLSAKISSELSQSSVIVVSGLARGIDTAAHKASIPNTIAVIAGGIDNIYPEENRKLQEKISQEGILLAEMPISSTPFSRSFPQRNRIISGLSNAVIIVEATLKSGSLITARFALEENREVFSCPGSPLDPRSKGTNALIKQGANLFEETKDVLEFLNSQSESFTEENNNFLQPNISKKVDETLLSDDNRKLIFSLLSSTPASIEELQQYSSLPFPIISTILLELELQGKIVYHPGSRYSINY